ncbi:MAG: hypothetical protein LBI19_10840 [Oscillospiraceae bacterium]|nr:hypothetical protein [Oscillospiraceae bacterium]
MRKSINAAQKTDLKACDPELVAFIAERYKRAERDRDKMVDVCAELTIEHAIDYLDSLCSLRFDLLSGEDKSRVDEAMALVVKKTVALQNH